MKRHRVVVTGVGAVSPFGQSASTLWTGLRSGQCAILIRSATDHKGLSLPVALVPPLDTRSIPRHFRRCMSPMSEFACLATREALDMAGYTQTEQLGISFASTTGSLHALEEIFGTYFDHQDEDAVKATAFFKIMNHSVATNVMQYLGCGGRQIASSAACASGLVSIGLAWESIAYGRARAMICGGADEFHPFTAATFNKLGALSTEQNRTQASLPFDARRSGLVCGEGAGALLLERAEDALARHAPILAECTGFSCISSPQSVAFPDEKVIEKVMREALDDAGVNLAALGDINAHATATLAGDEAEGNAIAALMVGQNQITVQSLKGHLGHTLAASGALESIACIQMLQHNLALPTYGLQQPSPAHLSPALLRKPATLPHPCILKNSFAMGGVYASLVLQNFSHTTQEQNEDSHD